jgi:hypothetical protein
MVDPNPKQRNAVINYGDPSISVPHFRCTEVIAAAATA